MSNEIKLNATELKFDDKTGIYYIDDYYKYWIKTEEGRYKNPDFDLGKGNYILDLKNNKESGIEYYSKKLIKIFKEINPQNSWITIVPSSKKDRLNPGMCNLINESVSQINGVKAGKLINRKQDIAKLATGGNRSIQTHLDSLELTVQASWFKGKNIYLIDDVTTTGNSLLACKKILEDAGADVICISLSKTKKDTNLTINKVLLCNLDKDIQESLNKENNYNINNALMNISDSFKEFKNIFAKYETVIENQGEVLKRKNEVYLYLIEQLELCRSLNNSLLFGDTEHYYELQLLICFIYQELVFNNGEVLWLEEYFKEVEEYFRIYGTKDIYIICSKFCFKFGFKEFNIDNNTTRSLSKFIPKEDTSSSYNYMANALYERNPKEALEYINKAIKLSEGERNLYLNKALILIKLGEVKEVIYNIKKAVSLQKNSDEIVIFKSYNIKSDYCYSSYNSSENIMFNNYYKLILKWLEKLNELVDSHELNYIIAKFIYEFAIISMPLFDCKRDSVTGEEVFKDIDKVENNIKLANEKSNNAYNEWTHEELVKKFSVLDYPDIKVKLDKEIYKYKKSSIDKYIEDLHKQEEQESYFDYDIPSSYYDTSGPDWLGGCESEDEFWEH